MATLSRLCALLAAALVLVPAPVALACTPTPDPQREFPDQTPEEAPLAQAYFTASDAEDLPAQEAAAKAWLAYRERTPPREHWFLAFILERLALAQGKQGKDADALANFARAYALYSKAFGPQSPEVRDTGQMYSIAQFKAGRIEEARATIKASSAAADATACPDSDLALGVLRTWGQIAESGGATAETADVWGEYAARRLRRFGENDPDFVQAELTQAIYLTQSERAAQALPTLARTIPRLERLGDDARPKVVLAQAWEAEALFATGRFKDAESRSKAVMEAARRALGPKDDATVLAEQTYLRTLIAQGSFDRAPKVFEDLFRARVAAFGADDGATLDLAELGADLYEKLGKYAAAELIRRHALDVSLKSYGPDSERALIRVSDLADLLMRTDRQSEAEALLLPVWTRIGARARSDVEIDTGVQLATIWIFQERYADAERLLRTLSARATQSLGPRSYTTLNVNSNLATAVGRRGQMREAETLHREVWTTLKSLRGEAHPATVLSGLQVAKSITEPARVQERVRLLMALFETLHASGQTGAANATNIAIMTTMAQDLMDYGLYDQSAAMWSEIRQAHILIYGEDSVRTRATTVSLARALGEGGKHAQAEPLFAELAATEDRLRTPGVAPSSDWINAQAWLGLSRTLQQRARDGYPSLLKAAQAVYERADDRRMTGSGAEERRKVLVDNRYIFNGLVRSGWQLAHEP